MRERLPYWITVFQRLVRIRSVFEEEGPAIALVEAEIAALGLAAIAVPFSAERLRSLPGAQPPFSERPGRRNVVAKLAGHGRGRSLILAAHLDIVPEGDPAAWTQGPFAGSIVDGVLYGRGAYDDKAGVVLALALIDLFAHSPRPAGDLTFEFVLEDEVTGNGTLLCLTDGHGADAAIVLDGTRGESGINEHAGNARFGVTVFGAPASVSVAHLGVNAAEVLAALVLELRDAVRALNGSLREPWTRFPSPNQLSTISLSCGESALTVPAEASAVCHATFTPPLTLEAFRRLVERVATDSAARHHLPRPIELDWSGLATEPVRSASGDLEAAVRRRARVEFGPSTGLSDLRHYASHGIPCVLFGPGKGEAPHRADERYRLESLPEMLRILHGVIVDWCGA